MIFNSFDQIKAAFSAPNVNNELDSMLTYLENAAEDFVIPYLSLVQWNKLVSDFEAEISTEAHLKLLKLARKAVAHFAYFYYADDGDMQINDHGFVRVEAEGEKTAYSGQILKFKRARLRDGWNSIESMLKLLQADKSTYNLWAASDEYKIIKSFFIWNTTEYRKYRSIKNLGVLDGLEGCTIHIQDEIIRKNVGDDLYTTLKTELAADNYSADNKLLIPYINKAIAHLIVERGIDEGLIQLSDEGVSLSSFEDKDSGGAKLSPADLNRISIVRKEAKNKGDAAIKDLRTYLNNNASSTKYTSYFNSDLYDDPTDTTTKQVFKNKPGSTFFAR